MNSMNLLLLCALFIASCLLRVNGVRVETPTASFIGDTVSTSDGGSIARFRGIPFAKEPVGNLRWKSPELLDLVRNGGGRVIDATKFGNTCSQMHGKSVIGDEDCLYLNVWTPSDGALSHSGSGSENTRPLLPVLVWIYGGGFLGGTTSSPDYDPMRLLGNATRSFVFVSVSYRLGPFGFLASKDLRGESETGAVGMLGIEDQRTALAWVRDHIAFFGGDPQRVTIEGESAGSISVAVHVASEASKGLFHGAILQSGSCDIVAADQVIAEDIAQTLMKKLGCADFADASARIACMRGKTQEDILIKSLEFGGMEIFGDLQFGPSVDGYNLREPCLDTFRRGNFNKVPLFLGSNHNEMALFFPTKKDWSGVSAETFPALAKKWTGDDKDLIAHYDPKNFNGDPREAFIRLLSERAFICSMRRLAALASFHGVNAYLYSFNHAPRHGLTEVVHYLGASHYLDVPMFYGNTPSSGKLVGHLDPDEFQLSATMRSALVRMVVGGSPNSPIASDTLPLITPAFPTFGSKMSWNTKGKKTGVKALGNVRYNDGINVNFDVPSMVSLETGRYKVACDLWDKAPLVNLPIGGDPHAVIDGNNDDSEKNKGSGSGGGVSTTVAVILGAAGCVVALVAVVMAVMLSKSRKPEGATRMA